MNWIKCGVFAVLTLGISACGFFSHYDFRGANIPEDVETFSVSYFGNEADFVNPSLSMDFTEKMKTKFQTETRLGLSSDQGDYQFAGSITRYSITPATLNNNTGTAQNQFSISVKLEFACPKHPEKNLTREFSFFKIFDASQNFQSIESALTEEITDNLVQQIFATVALDW